MAEKTNVDLVISGYTMEYYEQNKNQKYQVSVEEKLFNNQDAVRHGLHDYFDNMMMAVPWNKLYSARHIRENALRFPNLKWDDLHFNMDVVWDLRSVAISSSSGYHFFRSRAGSKTTIVFDGLLYKKRKEQFEHILKVYNHWSIQDENIMSCLYGYYAARIVQCVQEISISVQKEKARLVFIRLFFYYFIRPMRIREILVVSKFRRLRETSQWKDAELGAICQHLSETFSMRYERVSNTIEYWMFKNR